MKKDIGKIVKKSWEKYHAKKKLALKIPFAGLVQQTSSVLNEVKGCWDFCSGSGNNSNWLAEKEKKVLSIDYCANAKQYHKNKNIHFIKGDISKIDFNKYAKIINPELIIAHQSFDHVPKKTAFVCLNKINNINKKIKYIFITFLTKNCKGRDVVGKKIKGIDSFLNPISSSLNQKKYFELHSFYSSKEIKKILNILSNFKIEKKTILIEKYFDGKIRNTMETEIYLLKNISK